MRIKLIGVVAPGSRLDPVTAERARLVAGDIENGPHLLIHPQCFLSHGHFAGDDEQRASAFLDVANDPHFDAVWFARGGYGTCRVAEQILAQLNDHAREKLYLGYSDAAFLMAGLYRKGCKVAHGPMPGDMTRPGGDEALERALNFLNGDNASGLEPSLADGRPAVAFNMEVLSNLLGTPLEPDLTDHVLMLEEIGEPLYAIDRTMFHITSQASIRKVAGIRLGRISAVPENDPVFAETAEEIVQRWCAVANIPYLGTADIGHDGDNKIVPFGNRG